jgi:hypothetical protein
VLPLILDRVPDQMADGARGTSGTKQEKQRDALIDGSTTSEEQYSLGAAAVNNHEADCRISRSMSTWPSV